MPPEIEASTQAESPTVDATSQAFNAHSAAPAALQSEITAAWAKSQEGDAVDFEAENITPKQAAIDAAAKTKAPEVEEAEEEEEVEAPTEEEELEAKPIAKAKPGKLTQAESRALIEQRVELNKRFQRRDQQWNASRVAAEQALNQKTQELEPVRQALKLFEAGDLDGFATQLGAMAKDPSIKDWNTLNAAALNAVSNPMYKRMRQLERQSEERAQEMAQQARAQDAQRAEAAKAQEIVGWKQSLADEANSDEDPAIGNLLTTRPQMVDALFNIQQNHYHATGGDLLPARDAAAQLLKNVREDFKFWSTYFEEHGESPLVEELLNGDQAPKPVKQTDRAARVLERQTTKKTSGAIVAPKQAATRPNVPKVVKNISQAQTASASALKPLTEKQLLEKAAREMQQEWNSA